MIVGGTTGTLWGRGGGGEREREKEKEREGERGTEGGEIDNINE